jgi:3-oxoacyl-[acyl-carrier-protein] synthase II
MNVRIMGGGWVIAGNYGRMKDGAKAVMAAGDPFIPPVEEIYLNPPARYRRFDSYCQAACAAIALALRDAELEQAEGPRPMGIVASTRYGCIETDLAFQASAREADGLYASPRLFAFTLPGIAISEAAIHFRMTGPTFTVGEAAGQRGYQALRIGVDLLASGVCRTVLAGWLDAGTHLLKHLAEGDDGIRGAIFVVLSNEPVGTAADTFRQEGFELFTASGKRITSILDLVA